ncbi:MAG: hypothetical protein RKP46_13515, partial [Candidatus Accumulibacter sp.]|uniref:hypothetical protein n=1 Tax=Accumulibacter sp. TaxID=2053492 RepID=UPI00287A9238
LTPAVRKVLYDPGVPWHGRRNQANRQAGRGRSERRRNEAGTAVAFVASNPAGGERRGDG